MVATIMAPCSVKAEGGKRGSRCFWEPVTICDRYRASTSTRVRRNLKSSENRSALRLTADTLDQLNAASIRDRIALGQGAGARNLTLKNPALVRTNSTPKPFTANQNGFSLNCAVSCQAHQRDRLERLCRYITRPALCLERLSTNATLQRR
jgi:hypothetical protein